MTSPLSWSAIHGLILEERGISTSRPGDGCCRGVSEALWLCNLEGDMLGRFAVVAIGFMVSVLALATASDLDVLIPLGSACVLDGVLEEGEWNDALVVLLDDSITLFMKHAGGLLYLGIRAPDMGVGNLFIVRDGEVWVLHSSAALGTAIYEQVEDTWQLKQDFVWRCRARGFSASAVEQREEFFETEGWFATISYLGTPEDMEYKIVLDVESLQMLFVYLPVSNPTAILSWPPSVYQDVIPGPIPLVAHQVMQLLHRTTL